VPIGPQGVDAKEAASNFCYCNALCYETHPCGRNRREQLSPTREQAIEELRGLVLAALADRDATVWLFGSCARGAPRQHSDIDVAILPRDELPLGLFAELEADIEESTIPYDVDLVDLRRADPALIAEVRREGVKWRD